MSAKSIQKNKAGKESKTVTKREKYLKELKSMLKDIPDEGLLFLIRQAAVLIHNAAVEEENSRQIAADKVRSNTSKKKIPADKRMNTPASGKKPAKTEEKTAVVLEKGAYGKTFVLRFGNIGKTFDGKEISDLVRYVYEAKSAADGQRRIFAWFERNRKDVIIDAGISSEKSPAVKSVYTCLKKEISK